MGWIAKLLGAASKDERGGARFSAAPAWSVGPIKDAEAFFRALPTFLPTSAILYLEGVYAEDVIAFLRHHPIAHPLKLALGTIWPRPNYFHIPITSETMAELAKLAEKHAEPEIATHIHAYHNDHILLEWHDAFSNPVRISTTFSEARVRDFCESLHCAYKIEAA